jgi:hypothetical protein
VVPEAEPVVLVERTLCRELPLGAAPVDGVLPVGEVVEPALVGEPMVEPVLPGLPVEFTLEVEPGLEVPRVDAPVELGMDATEEPPLLVGPPLPPVEECGVLLDEPLDEEPLALPLTEDAGLPAWLPDDEELPCGAVLSVSAWATPDPLASAAPTPRISAPAPSHTWVSVLRCWARWRTFVRLVLLFGGLFPRCPFGICRPPFSRPTNKVRRLYTIGAVPIGPVRLEVFMNLPKAGFLVSRI